MNKRIFRAVEAAKNSATTAAKNQLEEVQIHTNGYAEPGYSGEIVATGNWNSVTRYLNKASHIVDDTPSRLGEVLEKLGVEIEWSDEWANCSCGKLVRTQANSYSWTQSFYCFDGEIECIDCVTEDPEGYLSYLDGNVDAANTMNVNLEEHGYNKIENDYESGLYGGQNDNPSNIAKALQDAGVDRFIFNIDSVGQFETKFSVYVHESEMHLIDENFEPERGEDPALALKRNLSEMSSKMNKLPEGEGIKYGYVKDGKGTARIVGREEFINGIKKDD